MEELSIRVGDQRIDAHHGATALFGVRPDIWCFGKVIGGGLPVGAFVRDQAGRFLYVNNRGHNSIAGFEVDAANGRLTAIEHVPTEPEARSMCLDPGGNFLFIAGLSSGRLVSYRLNRDSGKLTSFESYTVGNSPWHLLMSRPVN